MDSNRANQCNPNHTPSGPGRSAGYHGAGSKADLDNRANQMNPNNPRYAAARSGSKGQSANSSNSDGGSWCTIL